MSGRLRELRARAAAEHGFLGGLDALAFGALVFLTGTLLVLNAWSVVDTRMAVGAAAREAARAVADGDAGAFALDTGRRDLAEQGRARAVAALQAHGRDLDGWLAEDEVVLAVTTADGAAAAWDAPRCAVVTATVTFTAPTIALPFVGAFTGGGLPVTVTHRERIDPFRSGLAGEVSCG